MTQARSIYALYFTCPETGKRCYFYVGRSFDVRRREQQHRHLTARGKEDKYVFMRRLAARGIEWHTEVLSVIPEHEYAPDNERWWVIRLVRQHHELSNMRHGSRESLLELAAQVEDMSIRNPQDVRRDREQRADEAMRTSRKLRRQVQRQDLQATLARGIKDVQACGQLPPVLKRRLVREMMICIPKGFKLHEIYSLVRAQPRLDRLLAQCA